MVDGSILNTIGWRVEHLRSRLNNLTQTELAAQLSNQLGRKISQGYISKIERNLLVPPADVIAALAKIFQVDGEYLLLLTENPEKQIIPQNTFHIMTDEAKEATKIIDSLEAESRIMIVQMIKLVTDLLGKH